jgi:hypothetical protein
MENPKDKKVDCPECGGEMEYTECFWYDCPFCGYAKTVYPAGFNQANLADKSKMLRGADF